MKLTRTLVGVALLFFGIGLGVMAHTIVNAQEPDEEPEVKPTQTIEIVIRLADSDDSDDAWKEEVDWDIRVLQAQVQCLRISNGVFGFVEGEPACNGVAHKP